MPVEHQPIELSGDFNYALNLIEKEDRNIFITGKAGTGKSTLLQLFRNTTRKKAVVVAPTGIAALNVQGQTIHSFFGFPPRPLEREEIKRRRNRRLYQKMEVLVIDEISMVRADLLDNIDWFLRINRDTNEPFGGVQVVFFGDLFQLPPVVASDVEAMRFQLTYSSPYFFAAHVFSTGFDMEMLELQKVYRQENRHFLRLLEAVRLNRVDRDDLEDFNDRYIPDFQSEDFYITIAARNATANAINNRALKAIPFDAHTFQAHITGHFDPKRYPTEALLKLKMGAQVMFIKNDPEKQFVNGTIGKITSIDKESITVLVQEHNGVQRRIEVHPMEWEILKYQTSTEDPNKISTEVVGTFKQLPLKLAWAITIHKAQGKTFDKVIIDFGSGAFEHGQAYVALSRCRTLEGIVLKRPLRLHDVMIDERVVDFYETYFE
jgi:ATP-dependent DNA helicase PIF1